MSTIKANKLEHISTANGGIQLDNSGHVTVDGLQMPTAGALSSRNLVVNGACQVAQRGASGTSNGYNCVDRFGRDVNLGTGTFTDSQQSLGPSEAPYDKGFRKFFRTSSSSSSTPAGTSYLQVRYKIESQDIASSGWNYTDPTSYITLSFWVRASVTQTYGFSMQSHDGTDYVYNKTFFLVANTWTKVEQSIPGNTGLQFDVDNGVGLIIKWFPHLGSHYNSATDNTWDSVANANYGAFLGTSWWTASSATFDLTGVQLEVGSKATSFEHRSYGDELDRCRRYFQRYTNSSSSAFATGINGIFNSDTQCCHAFPFQKSMRTSPSFAISQKSDFDLEPFDEEPSNPPSLFGTPSKEMAVIRCDSPTTRTRGFASMLTIDQAGGYFQFDAEL